MSVCRQFISRFDSWVVLTEDEIDVKTESTQSHPDQTIYTFFDRISHFSPSQTKEPASAAD